MLLSLLLVSTLLVNAQGRGGNPEMRIQKRVEKLSEQLNLSTAQQAKLKDIFTAQQQNQKRPDKKMQDLSPEEKAAIRAERKTARAAVDQQIAGILTAEQLTTYENLPKEQRGKKGERGEKGKGKKVKGEKGGKGKSNATPEQKAEKKTAKLTEQLGLDANQQDQVYNLLLNQAATVKGKAAKELSKEERAALRETRKADRAAYESALAEILTPEQFTTFQNLPKKEKGKKGKKGKKNKNK